MKDGVGFAKFYMVLNTSRFSIFFLSASLITKLNLFILFSSKYVMYLSFYVEYRYQSITKAALFLTVVVYVFKVLLKGHSLKNYLYKLSFIPLYISYNCWLYWLRYDWLNGFIIMYIIFCELIFEKSRLQVNQSIKNSKISRLNIIL